MLIGVDCSHLTETGRTGTENYLYNLLKNLAVLDTENEYLLYFRAEPSESFWYDLCRKEKNWRYKLISSKISWVQVGLARATLEDAPDRLLCTWHTMPVLHNRKTKIISVIHDFSFRFVRSYPLYVCLLFSYKLVAVSEATYRGIVTRVPWRRRAVFMHYEGVDLFKYRKADADSIEATKQKYMLTKTYFLSVGTLTKRKNLENMVKAFSEFVKESGEENVEYIIVGKCAKGYESIFRYVAQTECGNKVRLLGRLDDKEVVDLYSGALSLLYVSKDEGFGLPILEAAACECNVVTANVASMKEVGGDSVLFADPNSIESIKSAIYYITDPKNKTALTVKKIAGLDKARAFSWKSCAEYLKKIY
jgi:glycosyltransferase involved in cell wall biosynthesis